MQTHVTMYISYDKSQYVTALYIYIDINFREFVNGPGDLGSIPGRVIPKTQKMVLNSSMLKTQPYKIRIKVKWSNQGKGVALSSIPRFSLY